ncbi:MAG: flagellar assembly protein FliW [Sedimentibacter sp.]|uniref:flagellar assembly protein FliW n=1 Tax=Sedimentibacter sp. TaxID=1960295 RepID=UPI00315849C2
MKINTRDFGDIDVNEEDVIRFDSGMYGFEEYKKYVILKDGQEDDIMYLQSVENADLSFVMIDPYAIFLKYDPVVNEDDLNDLEAKSESDLKFLVIAIIKESFKDSIVNLKSPVAINPQTKKARQVILQNTYPLRYKIIGEGDSEC